MIILCITNAGDIGNHTRSFPTIQHTNRLVSKVCHAFHINTRCNKNHIALTSLQEYRQVATGIRKCIRHTVNELGLGISQSSAIFRIDKTVTIQVTIDNISVFRINAL